MGYTVVDLADIEPAGPSGAVRFVRRELGATAFGINHFRLQPGASGKEHDESDSGQEEVICTIAGSGALTIDGDDLELRPGRWVRIDAEAVRQVTAGPDGLEMIVVGSPREGAYAPRGPF